MEGLRKPNTHLQSSSNNSNHSTRSRVTLKSSNKVQLSEMPKQGVCKCCGKLVHMYCFRCSLWRCCAGCEKRAVSSRDESVLMENPIPRMRELCLKKEGNSAEYKDVIFDNEELTLFEYTPVIIVEALGDYKYTVVLKANYSAVCKLSVDLTAADSHPLTICEGNLCAARYHSQWFRGQLSSAKPVIKVKYIDFGNEEIVSRADLKALPHGAMNMKAQAIKIELCPGTPKEYTALPVETELSVACVEKKGEVSLVLVKGISYQTEEKEKTVTPENPPISDNPMEEKFSIDYTENYVCLKEGFCFMTHVESVNEIFITPVTIESTDYQQRIILGLKQCQNATDNCIPVVGRVMAAKFIVDQRYYRALVISIQNREAVKVKFIDFGNIEIVSVRDLVEIPDNIINLPRLAVPVRLRCVRDVQCDELKAFFLSLIVSEERLTLKLSRDKRYVDLYLRNGEFLSNRINIILGKFAGIENKFLMSDVPMPSFRAGVCRQLYVHSVLYGADEICASTVDSLFIMRVINKQVEQFCENLEPYIPSENEVCFGQLQDAWHRCHVVNIRNNEAEVKMIDTGESAIVHNFRRMCQKYIDIEAGGLRCKLKDVKGNNKQEVKELVQMLLHPKSTIQATIIEQSGCNCMIEIPSLKELLNKIAC